MFLKEAGYSSYEDGRDSEDCFTLARFNRGCNTKTTVLFEQTFSCRFLVKITTYQRGDKVAMVIGHHPNLLRLLENVSDPFRRAIEHNM